MTKRQFLLSLLAGLMADRFGFARASGGISDAAVASVMDDLFSDLTSARLVGRHYLSAYPQKADRNLLLAELEMTDPQLWSDRQRLRQTLARHRRQQFLTGDTVIVDGWLLARSEAQLCALLVLG